MKLFYFENWLEKLINRDKNVSSTLLYKNHCGISCQLNDDTEIKKQTYKVISPFRIGKTINLDNNFGKEFRNTLQKASGNITLSEGFKESADKALIKCRPQSRKKIAIILGGCSSEYKVSLESAYAVISHINKEKYQPLLIDISSKGDWLKFNGDIVKITADTW